jgi:DNA-directed RNA polymerase sigma subunit (sigma70/sigma32)
MIKMRFGIKPYHRPHTYQEVSRSFGVVILRVVGLEEKVKEKFDLDVDLGFTKRDEGFILLDMG